MRAEEARERARRNHQSHIAEQYGDILKKIGENCDLGLTQLVYKGYIFPDNVQALRFLGYVLHGVKQTDTVTISWETQIEQDT